MRNERYNSYYHFGQIKGEYYVSKTSSNCDEHSVTQNGYIDNTVIYCKSYFIDEMGKNICIDRNDNL